MKKFEGFLLVSDIDGTLTDKHGCISRENAEAIRYFQSEGGICTVATGRYPDYIEHYAESFVPNADIIGINGTVLYSPVEKKIVCMRALHEEVSTIIRQILQLCPQIQLTILCSVNTECKIPKDRIFTLDAALAMFPRPWLKVIFVQNRTDSHMVRDTLVRHFGDRYRFSLSWDEGLEMHSMQSGKGALLSELVRRLEVSGHPIRRTICVGDYENDISMLQAADIGYAVSNAVDTVKAAADHVTVSNNESAIANIIAQL